MRFLQYLDLVDYRWRVNSELGKPFTMHDLSVLCCFVPAELVSETMALLEAEAETVMELLQRERQRAGTTVYSTNHQCEKFVVALWPRDTQLLNVYYVSTLLGVEWQLRQSVVLTF